MSEPTVCIMYITPQMAENWLQHNVENNRHLDNNLVDRYKFLMLNGDWRLSTDAIGFNVDDMLVNGQHRLWAIVESGVTIQAIVQKNLPKDSMDCIDIGKHRTNDDNFKIKGKNYPKDCSSTVRCIFHSINSHRTTVFTYKDIDHFMDQYHESINWVHKVFIARSKFNTSPFRAVLARAHILGKPLERLERFVTVLLTGLAGTEDGAAILLRNKILETHVKYASRQHQRQHYMLAETALGHFLNNRVPGRLLPCKEEMFPIDNIDKE